MKDLPVSSPDIVQIGSDNQTLTVKIAFLDVGQGDTIVISSPTTKEAIVVDCIDADSVLDYLEQEKIIHLRGIVITHLHDDHYSQVDDLLNRFHRVPGLGSCERLAFGKILNRANFGKLKQDSDGHQEEAKLST
ncbi:MAG: MBL fold metallo-hydrolase, partial [Ktedonobacteraceae bacterium]